MGPFLEVPGEKRAGEKAPPIAHLDLGGLYMRGKKGKEDCVLGLRAAFV